jgi:hypothetical protein
MQDCWQTLSRYSAKRKIVETESGDRGRRFSHDAAFPELFAKPVTDCRCLPMHVLARVKIDPGNRGTVNLDAKKCGRLLAIFFCKNSCASSIL